MYKKSEQENEEGNRYWLVALVGAVLLLFGIAIATAHLYDADIKSVPPPSPSDSR